MSVALYFRQGRRVVSQWRTNALVQPYADTAGGAYQQSTGANPSQVGE